MTAWPSGTVTFLMTDIEGSTRMWEEHRAEMASVLPRHDALLEDAIARYNGLVVKRRLAGDSFMAVFVRASEGVAAAAAAQRTLTESRWPDVTPLRVRMAIHTGEAEPLGDDYFGTTVNHCARLREVAHGGQTLLSRAAYSLLAGRPPDGVEIISLGRHVLRDLKLVDDVYQVTPAGLSSDFPPLKTVDAFPNNLQHIVSSFIGRQQELQAGRLLLTEAQLVTFTGPGGSGKTRLALQLAAEQLERFADGVWAIDLAPLRTDDDVARAIAAVKGIHELPGVDLIHSIRDHIGSARELLLLDNCEHLTAACARLAEALGRHCPNVAILATSREPLSVAGENVFGVPAMAMPAADGDPASAATIRGFDAVALFVERAKEIDRRFTLTDSNASAVAELCRLLDGMPLALELAAPLVGTLSVADIVDRLRAFPLRDLMSLDPTVEERHRSVIRMIEWSYSLLSPREQTFFARLSVFAEGFSMSAVEAVCTGADVPADDVLDLMSALIRKSLVMRTDEPAGVRYRLLWTLREFSRRQLTESESSDRRARHADHYAHLAIDAGPRLAGAEQQRWQDVLTAESANIDLALDALHDAGRAAEALDMATALWRHWYIRGRFAAGRSLLERCLAAFDDGTPPSTEAQANALFGAGTLATFQGDFAVAQADLEQSISLWRTLGDTLGEARTLNGLASVHQRLDHYDAAHAAWTRCMELLANADQPLAVATVRYNLAAVHEVRCELAQARAQTEACMREFDRLGHRHGVAHCMLLLGILSVHQGDVTGSRHWFVESIAVFEAMDDGALSAVSRMRLGYALFLDGVTAEGEALLRLAHETFVRMGREDVRFGQCLHHLAAVALGANDFDRARALLEQCRALGVSVQDDWVRALALDGLGRLELYDGSLVIARHLLQESLGIRRSRHLLLPMIESLDSLALQADAEGHRSRAVRLVAASAAQRTSLGLVNPSRLRAEVDGVTTRSLDALGPSAFGQASAEGAALGLEEACELAMDISSGP